MQCLAIFTSLLAAAWADSYLYPVPAQQLQTPIVFVKTVPQQQEQPQLQQYFTQDSLGQYSYGYAEPLSSKQEVRTLDGITRGSYSYIDAHGLLQTVDYTADGAGFHVAATNLPIDTQKAVTETPEVALARQHHLAAHQAILNGDLSSSSILPRPVEDTVEVAAAKKDFFARYAMEEEKQRLLLKASLLKSHSSESTHFTWPAVKSAVKPPAKITENLKTPSGTVHYGYGFPVPSKRFYLPVV